MTTKSTNDKIIMYTTSWCSDCHRAKHFLNERGIDYINIDVELSEAGMAFVKQINGGSRVVPTIVFPDGTLLVEPSNAALAAKLNAPEKMDFEW